MEEENLSNSFYEANNMLIPKLHKASTNETKQNKKPKKPYRPISLTNLHIKILSEILVNHIWQCIKRLFIMTEWDLFQICKASSTFTNQSYDHINWHRNSIWQKFNIHS